MLKIVFQWGAIYNTGTVSTTITFPLAMNVSPYCILGGCSGNNTTYWGPKNNRLFSAYNISNTKMSISLVDDDYNYGVFWAIIGQ